MIDCLGSVTMMFKKDNSAVSPVIATILMVSVTVVLAAVLYVMILGMGAGTSEISPLGSWYSSEVTSNSTATFVFGTFGYEVRCMDMKLFLTDGVNETVIEFPGPLQNRSTSLSISGANSDTITVTYEDNNWELSNVNGGDKLFISGLKPDVVYTVKVFHKPTDDMITMAGADSSVQTSP